MQLRNRSFCVQAVTACLAVASLAGSAAAAPTAKTVPWIPANPAVPHDTYAGKSVTMKGTSDMQGVNIHYDWDFGDGSPHATGTVTNQFNVSAAHTYAGATGTIWTAVLTLTDTNLNQSSTANYLVAMRDNNLSSNVNVAIDEGLWYLHITMRRYVVGATNEGDWTSGCPTDTGVQTVCHAATGDTATNLQAFQVNSHLEAGPASDPYTDDVSRGLKYLFSALSTGAISNHNITCQGGPCLLHVDGNGNGFGAFVNQSNAFYQGGMVIDAIVASGTPNAVTTTGPAASGTNPGIAGRTYKDVIQDMVDEYAYCQSTGSEGGGWRYSCQDFPDNSVCQWGAIGIIGAIRGFGVTIDPNIIDSNKVWLAASEAANGVFGYTSTAPAWGPYATTPSGMVQLTMDSIGRGDPRWDHAETYLRDNFGNAPTNSNTSIKAYYYGLFSFTKAMLLHSPGGVLTPITLLQSQTAGVTPLDWYAAQAPPNGTDPTDGVARWLVSQQKAAGYWFDTLQTNTAEQWPFSTGFAIIMLRRSVFTACVNDLTGKGTPSGRAATRVDLTWTGITGADHYLVLRGTTTGGPYTQVGSATITAYSDTNGLQNGATYYYVLQPATAGGAEICQSNEAKVTVPNAR